MKAVILAVVSAVFILTASDTDEKNRNVIPTLPTLAPATQLTCSDISTPKDLPAIGKWMHENDGTPAHWLGVKWRGKNLIEPINVILVDNVSKSAEEARSRLFENMRLAGYTKRNHHSSGYRGYIDGRFYGQLPTEKYNAIADRIAEEPNNHGRLFGPCRHNGKYVFTAAFSRETLFPAGKIMHRYHSFTEARDAFAGKLDRRSGYKIVGKVSLDNAIGTGDKTTTGDHDGWAVVLSLDHYQ